MPDIDWREGRAGNRGKLLLETTQKGDLQQMVSFPTHIKGNILDLVITNCPDKVLDISDGGRLGKSDHCIIMVDIECNIHRQVGVQKTLNWSRANYEGIKNQMARVDWEVLLNEGTVEDAWSSFKERLQTATIQNISEGKRGPWMRNPWMTREIIRLLRCEALEGNENYWNSGCRQVV
jgi:hypothetical protein